MNRSKDLRDLFKKSLINKRKEAAAHAHSPFYANDMFNAFRSYHKIPGQTQNVPAIQPRPIRIYFYEWSDITKGPRSFFMLEAFKSFLVASGIHLEFCEEEIIRNLGTVYITCYRGTKNLSIRSTYGSLVEAMSEYDSKQLIHTEHCPLINQNVRMTMNDGTFFG